MHCCGRKTSQLVGNKSATETGKVQLSNMSLLHVSYQVMLLLQAAIKCIGFETTKWFQIAIANVQQTKCFLPTLPIITPPNPNLHIEQCTTDIFYKAAANYHPC